MAIIVFTRTLQNNVQVRKTFEVLMVRQRSAIAFVVFLKILAGFDTKIVLQFQVGLYVFW